MSTMYKDGSRTMKGGRGRRESESDGRDDDHDDYDYDADAGHGVGWCGRVKGGGDGDAALEDLDNLDESTLVSTVAMPGLSQVRAFLPNNARHMSSHLTLDGKHAWFYPDPPWGRKDCIRPGSKFLQTWDMVVWVAMVYVAIAVPFRAAGFTRHETDFRQVGNTCGDHRRLWWDAIVDLLFVMDMVFSLHTAYYKSVGPGKYVLVDDLVQIRKHYTASLGFVCDFLGIVPLKEVSAVPRVCLGYAKGVDVEKYEIQS
jgi:hypothetical protein